MPSQAPSVASIHHSIHRSRTSEPGPTAYSDQSPCLTLDFFLPFAEEKGKGRKNYPLLEEETSPRQDPATSWFGFHE